MTDNRALSPETAQNTKNEATSTESPLDPAVTTRLCTFSPCIEQVQRTISTLRQLGWVDIEMVEIAARRIEIRRERVGLQEEGLRGVNASPASVEEAVARLKEVEGRCRTFHEETSQRADTSESTPLDSPLPVSAPILSKKERLESNREALANRKIYKEGRLVHRAEPELKTHTSYLVFALLPREWTAEDEERCRQTWPPVTSAMPAESATTSRRQMKKAARLKASGQEACEPRVQQVEDTNSVDPPLHTPDVQQVDPHGQLP